MTKDQLNVAVQAAKDETRAALEVIFAELNPGQRKKLLKNPTIAALVERYRVEVDA